MTVDKWITFHTALYCEMDRERSLAWAEECGRR
jgi:hypothetical protein